MKVTAAPGLLCPMEGKPREYITDDPEGIEVEPTAYYRRLVDDGSLVEVVATSPKQQKTSAASTGAMGGDQ